MDRLEHRAMLADVGRRLQPDRVGDLRRDLAEDVAVKVGHDKEVKGL